MALPEFEVLVDLARNDPDELEAIRQSLTREVIDGARTVEHRQRLTGLQFRIDMECRRSGSPMGAAIRLSEMMCRSLADLQMSIVAPHELDIEEHNTPAPASNVLSFPRRT